METPSATWSMTTPRLAMDARRGMESLMPDRSKGRDVLRERVGEFVGNVFYGTLMKQMQASKLKGKYFHGGRGEEVFQGQLNMELARRMGQAVGDPIAEKMYASFVRNEKSKQNAAAVDRSKSVAAFEMKRIDQNA